MLYEDNILQNRKYQTQSSCVFSILDTTPHRLRSGLRQLTAHKWQETNIPARKTPSAHLSLSFLSKLSCYKNAHLELSTNEHPTLELFQ